MLPLDEPGKELTPLERLMLPIPRDSDPFEPLENVEEECADVRSGRRLLLDPPGTGGAGREGVSEEPFQDAISRRKVDRQT